MLAVDDDGLVLLNTATMLEELGHRALAAGSAAQALEILAREPGIDLIVTDQVMPRVTGLELVDTIRADHPLLPVVLVTGHANLMLGTRTAVTKLTKPFRLDDLRRAIAAETEAKR